MNNKKALRMAIDLALSIMTVFEMLIQFTGDFLHEVVGFAFFATVALHIALSFSWVKKTAHKASEGTLKARQASLAIVGCLLGLSMLVLGVSSVAISGILESAGFVWPFGEYDSWVVIHTVSSYALCALVVVHLAMHWVFFASALKVPYNPSRRRAIGMGVNTVAALGVAALGVTALNATLPQISQADQSKQNDGNANSLEGIDAAAGSEDASASASAGLEESNASASAGSPAADGIQDAPSAKMTQGQQRGGKGKRDNASTRGNAKTRSVNPNGQESPGEGTGSAGTQDNGAGQLGSAGGPASNGTDAANGAGSGENATGQESTGSGYSSSDICTLCRKRCTFDNLRCDKPYREGLL